MSRAATKKPRRFGKAETADARFCTSEHKTTSEKHAKKVVKCTLTRGHKADGSDCMAYHLGPKEMWRAGEDLDDGTVLKRGQSMRRVWTDDEAWHEEEGPQGEESK